MRQFALLDYNQWQYSRTLTPVVYWPLKTCKLPSSRPCTTPKPNAAPAVFSPFHPERPAVRAAASPSIPCGRCRLVIGAVGLMALLFVVLLMYRMVSNEDAANAPAPVDEAAAEQQKLFPDPPPANGKPAEPSKPDKPPPLNER